MARLAVRGLDPEAELRRLAAAKEVFMSAAAHYADIEKRLLD
jgi:hypothetical protein